MTTRILVGDCRERMAGLDPESIDACVTDPPYELGFMGKSWDRSGVAFDPETWASVHRVLKPGGHLLAFGGTRTVHRIACAIEEAGFEIRDQIAWLYGSGFPKSMDVSKAIDKAADYRLKASTRRAAVEAVEAAGLQLPGNSRWDWTNGEHAPGNKWWAEFLAWLPTLSDEDREKIEREVIAKGYRIRRESVVQFAGLSNGEYDITAPSTDEARKWDGWGTALKPAMEPIIVARKPLRGTVAQNVTTHGTGALNIDGCRIGTTRDVPSSHSKTPNRIYGVLPPEGRNPDELNPNVGRWPANVVLDEVAAELLDEQSGERGSRPGRTKPTTGTGYGGYVPMSDGPSYPGETGGASRFFYCAKADRAEREIGMDGADVKPLLWSAGTQNPGSFQAEGTNRTARNNHPTVKPIALMQWLVRLVTPPGGLVLDPFLGSGTTGIACDREGFNFIGIELSPEYAEISRRRVTGDAPMFADVTIETTSRAGYIDSEVA